MKSWPSATSFGFSLREQIVVEANLGVDGVLGRDPMDGGFHLAPVGRVAAARCRIVGAMNFDHFAGLRILHHAGAGDEVAVAQPHFAAGRQPEILLGRIFAEIVLLDVEHARKGHLRASRRLRLPDC